MFPSRLFIRNTDFNKRQATLFISFRAACCQFLHRTKADTISFQNHTFQETLYKQWMETDSTVPTRLPVLLHLGTFPAGFGDLLGWLLLSHLITVHATPAIPPWLFNHTSQVFPSHFTLFLSTTRNYLLTYGKIHKTDLEGKENPVLGYVHWHKDLGKALQGETSPAVGCGSTGSPAVPQHSCVHVSTSKAALPSHWQHFPPIKPKGSERPSWAVLPIYRP